jgi:hypothetical protein
MSTLTLFLFAIQAVTTITVGDIVVNAAKYRFSLQMPGGLSWTAYWKMLFVSEHGRRAKLGLTLFHVGIVLLGAFAIALLAHIRHNPHFLSFS